jgi:hypothetical protein
MDVVLGVDSEWRTIEWQIAHAADEAERMKGLSGGAQQLFRYRLRTFVTLFERVHIVDFAKRFSVDGIECATS